MKYNPFTNIVFLSAILLVFIGILLISNFKTANVVLEYEENFNIGQQLGGKLSITIEPSDSIEASTPISVSLSKGREILAVETLTFNEFIKMSSNPVSPTEKNGNLYYETPGTYSVDTSSIINYKFTEKGEYELFFSLLKLDLNIKKRIIVR